MIDVKELRIGAHVSLRGERVTIFQTIYTGLVEVIRPNKEFEVCTTTDELDPIPLTAELLQELGFVKTFSNVHSKEFGGEYFSQTIEVSNPIGVCSSVYGVSYRDDDNHNYYIGCRYLHELEAFVYLTTKQELIKEDRV